MDVVDRAKRGTLVDPHESATVIDKIAGEPEDREVTLSGPGIDGRLVTKLPRTAVQALRLRDLQEYEYPQGIDFIFLLDGAELLCIPRLVRMEES